MTFEYLPEEFAFVTAAQDSRSEIAKFVLTKEYMTDLLIEWAKSGLFS